MEVEQPNAKVISVKTKDGVQYKIEHQVFCRHSRFYNTMVQDSIEDEFTLYTIHSNEFDYLFEFMQLHKHDDPRPLLPLSPGISLRTVMEEADAELVERIFSNASYKAKSVIDAAFFLHMNHLLRRLTAGIMAGLSREQTKRMALQSKKSGKVDELQVSGQIHKKIEMILFKNKEQQPQSNEQKETGEQKEKH